MQTAFSCAECGTTNEDVAVFMVPGFGEPVALCPRHKPAGAEPVPIKPPDFGRVLGAFRTGHLCSQCRQVGKIAFYETVLGIAYHIIEAHQEP